MIMWSTYAPKSSLKKQQTVTWPPGYKTLVQSQPHNKAQCLAACGHMSASSQSVRFSLSLRMNSSFITSRPDAFYMFMLP